MELEAQVTFLKGKVQISGAKEPVESSFYIYIAVLISMATTPVISQRTSQSLIVKSRTETRKILAYPNTSGFSSFHIHTDYNFNDDQPGFQHDMLWWIRRAQQSVF